MAPIHTNLAVPLPRSADPGGLIAPCTYPGLYSNVFKINEASNGLPFHISSDAAFGKHAPSAPGCDYFRLLLSANKQFSESSGKDRRQQAGVPQPVAYQLVCLGTNIRSLLSLENSYSFHRVLEGAKPDLFFLVETWHKEANASLLRNQNYRILLSESADQRGGGVAIVHNAQLIVTPLFPEFHSRNFLLARLSSISAHPVILMAVYFPPDHARKEEMIAHVIRVLDYLHSRYGSFGLLAFGDLNTDLLGSSPEAKKGCSKLLRMIRSYGLKVHAETASGTATRVQGSRASYLDYFLSTGVEVKGLTVGEAVGTSDHKIISCQVRGVAPVKRTRQKIYSKLKAQERLVLLTDEDHPENLLHLPPESFFEEVSRRLQSHSVIFEPKPKSFFKVIEVVENELKGRFPNWNRVRREISSCKSLEFLALINEANSRKLEGDWLNFHKIVRSILGVRKNSASIREIEDPQEEGCVIHDPAKLQAVLSNKYKELFMSDSPRDPFMFEEIEPTSLEEVTLSVALISSNRGLGIDCVPDTILQDDRPEIREKLVGFVNTIFKRTSIPIPFSCARLHLLNKLKSGTPGLEDLRPIMITSPIIKLIESIALKELKERLEPLICSAQTGFLTGLGTQVHILRLVGRMRDICGNPRFKSGNWFAFFVDFKSAFDKVDHLILFRKLQDSGVSLRTINILKLLYNSYHFSLLGDSPKRIKSGVAQGSLVSPLLYDWYVNDLVSLLSRRFGAEHTFAYADDIALLCLGYSDLRSAISILEEWSRENGAILNRKKCGILPIRRREVPVSRKELEGIPFVQTYKYLGVPLDSSLTLKYLASYLEGKLKKFSQRIGLVLHSVVGTKTRLNLWQNYARCYFDYFSPTVALCDQFSKFERLFSKSLKKALGLPLHLSNDLLLKVVGVPSLQQIAGHHVSNTAALIHSRFSRAPSSLGRLAASLSQAAVEYQSLSSVQPVKVVSLNSFVLDLLSLGRGFERNLLGLATGTFLTLRCTHVSEGTVGTVRKCAACGTPATQTHFLNECSVNEEARRHLKQSIPNEIIIPLLSTGDFAAFFAQIRCLPAEADSQDTLERGFEQLVDAALAAASACVVQTLKANDSKR